MSPPKITTHQSGLLHQNYFNQLNPQFNSQLFQSQLNARLGINGGSIEGRFKPAAALSLKVHFNAGLKPSTPASTAASTPPTVTTSNSPTPVTTTTPTTSTTAAKEHEEKKDDASADDEGPDQPIVELENFQLWSDFHQFGTEMVITKTGRSVYYSLIFNINVFNQIFFCPIRAFSLFCVCAIF